MHDLIVVGAGPCGSSAARAAARAGLDTLIFDKDDFPRDKPCAGALSMQVLEYLDFPLPEELVERRFYGGELWYRDSCITVRKPYPVGVLVSRARFDNLLLQQAVAAGAQAHTGVRVLDYRPQADHVAVHTSQGSFAARQLIIAEGAAGRLKLPIRGRDQDNEYTYCVCADIPVNGGNGISPEAIVIRFGVSRVGYGWIFNRGRDASVGLGELGSYLDKPGESMRTFLASHHIADNSLPLKAHKIPLGGIRRRIADARVFLAGDAAGFADALLGEGIAYAVRSGQLAAQAVVDGLRSAAAGANGAAGATARYAAACHRAFGDELRHTLILSKALKHLPRRMFQAVLSDEEALSRYVDILAGKTTYRTFNHWMALRLPRYAWRALRS